MPTDHLRSIAFCKIEGWKEDDHNQALSTFRLSATEILKEGRGFNRPSQFGGKREDWVDVCRKALAAVDGKSFFENEFCAFNVSDEAQSLFTGYYEPQAFGSTTPTDDYFVPIYAKPNDLASRIPYFSRREIEAGALKDQGLELCYLNSWEEAYFIHIQGNGRILLPDGKALRLSFAAKNGLAYNSIGRLLLGRGIGSAQTMSMQFLKTWMRDNPEAARKLMWENPSFIFFSADTQIDPVLGAIGAAKVPLTPMRSLAVDRSYWAFGTPLFLSTHLPSEAGGDAFHKLMIAQDTGSAIKGVVRGDVYFGWGPQAELAAGHMKQPGQMLALLPKPLAERLLQ
ncbi:MAG: MltA domain-containing protein [Aestuariivirga sp.]